MSNQRRLVSIVSAVLVGTAAANFVHMVAADSFVPIPRDESSFPSALLSAEAAKSPLEKCRDQISFLSVKRPSLAGFRCRHTAGPVSVWMHETISDVIVIDLRRQHAVRIAEFPFWCGPPAEAGWRAGKDFYIHFANGYVVSLDPYESTVSWVERQPLR